MATTKQVKDFIRKVAPVAQAKASGRENGPFHRCALRSAAVKAPMGQALK